MWTETKGLVEVFFMFFTALQSESQNVCHIFTVNFYSETHSSSSFSLIAHMFKIKLTELELRETPFNGLSLAVFHVLKFKN